MNRHRLASLVAALFALSLSVTAQEKKVAEKDVPKAVLAAFKSTYPNATIRGYSREKENGKVYYEIESMEGEIGRDVLYNPDGTVAEIEETIAPSDLPPAVSAAFRRLHPEAIIKKAEKISRDGQTEYEITAKEGKRRIELEFDSDGNPLKKP